MKKKIFCITGKTGSGKSSFLEKVYLKLRAKSINIDKLIYCTTREKRDYEKDGKDYYFYNDQYKILNKADIIESRKYTTVNGPVYYFTTKQCLENNDNFIVAAGIEQLANYINNQDIDVYEIRINCSLKNRMNRTINNRCNSDNDIMELCRRVIKEEEDFIDPYVLESINKIDNIERRLVIDNNYDNNILIEANVELIYNFIVDRIGINN